MSETLQLVENHGIALVMSVVFLSLIIHEYRTILPKIVAIEQGVSHMGSSEAALRDLARSQQEAMEQFAKSNENVAHSLELLRITLEGMSQDIKETKSLGKDHDGLGEKIFTAARVNGRICDMILTNQTTRKRASAAVSKITADVEKEVQEERGRT